MARVAAAGAAIATLLLAAQGAGGATQLPHAASALDATNALFATPWGPFSHQTDIETEHALEAYDGKKLAGGSGSVGITYKGASVTAKWVFGVEASNVKAQVDIADPPGITAASPTEIGFAAPRNGAWRFGLQGTIHPYAYVKVAGVKIWQAGYHRPFALQIRDFRVVAHADLDGSEPDRPKLVQAVITPSMTLAGAGVFGGFAALGALPVTFKATVQPGKLTLRADSFDLPLSEFGFADAHFNGRMVVVMEPSSLIGDADAGLIEGRTRYMNISVQLKGKLTAEIRYVPKAKESFDFEIMSFKGTVPTFDAFNDFLRLTKQPTPRSWGEGQSLGRAPAPSDSGVHYADHAAQIESGIAAHMPYGAVLSIDCETLNRLKTPGCSGASWAGDEDSAIWTGHYLAAESFRYAAGDAGALARIETALSGIERLFWVTGDVAYHDKKRSIVASPTGILARTAAPVRARGEKPRPDYGTPLARRKCYYERPEGGWAAGGQRYASFRAIPASARDDAQTVGRVWQGWGCGDDHPVTKDQYIGIFYGLAAAHALVPSTQPRIKKLVDAALDYLVVKNKWNIRLPPDERIEMTFLGDFPKQLALLRLGATANRARWGQRYADAAPAASEAWVPIWFSASDPLFQYFKFNLSNAALTIGLMLEEDPTVRLGLTRAQGIMWRAVRHHRNAYFSLLRVLARLPQLRADLLASKSGSNPDISVSQEARSILTDWIARLRLTGTANGMPTGAIADPPGQIALWSGNVADFVGLAGSTLHLSKYALPLTVRIGRDKDFVWQRDPFHTSFRANAQGCQRIPPTQSEVVSCGAEMNRIHPGVDYLIAYWLARYLNVLPPTA
jgi:hypothetical protein